MQETDHGVGKCVDRFSYEAVDQAANSKHHESAVEAVSNSAKGKSLGSSSQAVDNSRRAVGTAPDTAVDNCC